LAGTVALGEAVKNRTAALPTSTSAATSNSVLFINASLI
jgi:hypothetical protein